MSDSLQPPSWPCGTPVSCWIEERSNVRAISDEREKDEEGEGGREGGWEDGKKDGEK